MYFGRSFATCPFLRGGPEGVICGARGILVRNLDTANADLCISRHFEVCQIYIEHLKALDVLHGKSDGFTHCFFNSTVTFPS